MSGHVHLSLYGDLEGKDTYYRVRVGLDNADMRPSQNGLVLRSLSPIFPLGKEPFIPAADASYRIIFIVHNEPFVQFGRLNDNDRRNLWFSLGITGLISIQPLNVSVEETLSKLDNKEILCREIWEIESGVMKPSTHVAEQIDMHDGVSPPATNPDHPDLRRVVRELYLNFESLLKRAHILMPSLMPTVKAMLSSIEKETHTITEQEALIRTAKGKGSPSETAARAALHLDSHKSINLATDALIQLNSAFAYILSQSFYGGPPLAYNLSLNSCHSLLGIGTAIKGIQKLTDFIIEGFGHHPVANAVKSHFGRTTLSTFLKPEDTGVGKRSLTPDDFLVDVKYVRQTSKLAYFSTRMGFSEHGYCVTAATQCLASADAARRSLLTLSHELLHSHVKGILSIILAGAADGDSKWSDALPLAAEYRKLAKEYRADPTLQKNWTILQFLRFRIFAFCDGVFQVVSECPGCRVSDDGPARIAAGPATDDESELERFKNAFSFLNEVIVHVLDLHYFYDASERIFLSTLWSSWANIPGVADKIEWYILRCLVAVSVINVDGLMSEDFDALKGLSGTDGKTLDQRFEQAVQSLQSVLEELSEVDHTGPILEVVLERLRTPSTLGWIRRAFFPCHLFAQVVKQFLYSPKLRDYFDSFEDPLADRDEEGVSVYNLAPLEFIREPIKNPIAFLRDRLRRPSDDSETSDEEQRSAWLFLALASLRIKPQA